MENRKTKLHIGCGLNFQEKATPFYIIYFREAGFAVVEEMPRHKSKIEEIENYFMYQGAVLFIMAAELLKALKKGFIKIWEQQLLLYSS